MPETTDFAPSQRLELESIQVAHSSFSASNSAPLLDAVPTPILVINKYRQIIYANDAFRTRLTSLAHDALLGARPGEALECAFLKHAKGGCGTSIFCKECGATRAIMTAVTCSDCDTTEFHLLREHEGDIGGLDLMVSARPYTLGNESYYILSITDISDEKRRRYLERIFFHDIINTAGGARGLAEILHEGISPEHNEDAFMLVQSLNHLVDEIQNHKTILAAENNDLTPHFGLMDPQMFVKNMADKYSKRRGAEKLVIRKSIEPTPQIQSDQILLGRVVGNMIKNAIEASPDGSAITVGCTKKKTGVIFWVNNPGKMPAEVQHQIFKRSFSTKGHDRGLGTFSMRLLTQNYLGGKVSFFSNKEEGTTFSAFIPF